LTMTLFFSHRLEETNARATEALDVAKRAGSETLRVETMLLIGLKHLCYGELKEAKVVLDDIIATARRLNHKPALMGGVTWRACLHFFQSEYAQSVELASEGRRLASELRDGFLMLTALFFIGLSQGNQGKMSDSLATLHEGMEKARRNGDLFWGPRMPNCIGWVHRELQDFEAARRYNEDGRQIAQRHHVLEAEANSLINLGIDFTHSGDREKTTAAFHDVVDIFSRDAWFRWRYNIRFQAASAADALRHGDVEKAHEFVVRLQEMATEYECHKYLSVAHQLMAEVEIAKGNLVEAQKNFSQALLELENYPAPVVAWKTHAGLARLNLQLGDRAGAREEFKKAAEIVTAIAANIRDEGLRTTFLNSNAVTEVISKAT